MNGDNCTIIDCSWHNMAECTNSGPTGFPQSYEACSWIHSLKCSRYNRPSLLDCLLGDFSSSLSGWGQEAQLSVVFLQSMQDRIISVILFMNSKCYTSAPKRNCTFVALCGSSLMRSVKSKANSLSLIYNFYLTSKAMGHWRVTPTGIYLKHALRQIW